VENLDILNNM